jgi:hypothetical protein
MQEGMRILSGTWQTVCRNDLENRKRIAKEQDDDEAFNKICAIIQREQQQTSGGS